MSHISDTSEDRNFRLMEFFRSTANERYRQNGSRSYIQAVSALGSYLDSAACDGDIATVNLLSEWLINMYVRQLSYKTAQHYLDAVSALYSYAVKQGIVEKSNAFNQLKSRLRMLPADGPQLTADRFTAFIATLRRQGQKQNIAADIIQASLIYTAKPVSEVAQLKTTALPPAMSEIAARQSSPRRRYLFNLRQSENTPRQLRNQVNNMVFRFMSDLSLPLYTSVQQTLESIWAYAALTCGATGSEIVALLGHYPVGIPLLQLCQPIALSAQRSEQLKAIVAHSLSDNPHRWYAMRLRPRVDYKQLCSRISAADTGIGTSDLFYPCDEIARRIGRKLVFRQQPVISDVVFFRSRATDILPLFSNIGDIAWCYTISGRPGSAYAPISQQAFQAFQQAIGHFTPCTEIAPIGQLEPRQGEKVVIVGGLFQGHRAEIADISHSSDADTNTLYRFNFVSNNGIEWRVAVDSRQTHPVK